MGQKASKTGKQGLKSNKLRYINDNNTLICTEYIICGYSRKINIELPCEIISILSEYLQSINSKILKNDQECLVLNMIQKELNLYGKYLIGIKLLYRSNIKNKELNTATQFHEYCDNKGPTITIIRTNYNHIFGGYTSIPWSDGQKKPWKSDPTSFLFTIKPKFEIFKQKDKYSKYSVYHSKQYSVAFGEGNDFVINNNSNEGTCYGNCSYNTKYGSDLCGGPLNTYSHFNVNRYEVFLVQYI